MDTKTIRENHPITLGGVIHLLCDEVDRLTAIIDRKNIEIIAWDEQSEKLQSELNEAYRELAETKAKLRAANDDANELAPYIRTYIE